MGNFPRLKVSRCGNTKWCEDVRFVSVLTFVLGLIFSATFLDLECFLTGHFLRIQVYLERSLCVQYLRFNDKVRLPIDSFFPCLITIILDLELNVIWIPMTIFVFCLQYIKEMMAYVNKTHSGSSPQIHPISVKKILFLVHFVLSLT